jgi:hypothetical protein
MNDHIFMRRLFDGYVLCYRQFQWHKSSNFADMTAAELGFFSNLGNSLGYVVRREMCWQYPRDLCWCGTTISTNDSEAQTLLYLERENENEKAIETVQKLTKHENSKDIPYLVALFGWVRRNNLEAAKSEVRQRLLAQQHCLLISWIGEKKDQADAYTLEGWVCSGRTESVRSVTPKIDDAGYWYADSLPTLWTSKVE